MERLLILEDGSVYRGTAFGSDNFQIGELVFNTSMTGYQEILTDNSYCGQIVMMTYPLIGNYGICFEDMEADKPWQSGFITREIAKLPSNFRNQESLEKFLVDNKITGIEGVDTRTITKILTTDENYNLEAVIPKLKEYEIGDVVRLTTCKEIQHFEGDGFKVAVIDLGAKKNIIRELTKRGCDVTVYPSYTKAETILEAKPDGIMLTNGPGDPKTNVGVIEEIKKLFATKVPIFAICLGHQLLALANGADTEKMKYGHRGANHPVKDLKTGKVYISTQNHGYMVKESTIDRDIAEVSFVNVNDGTVEGVHYLGKNVQTVQFHPEACAGPLDTNYLFDEFMNMMEVSK